MLYSMVSLPLNAVSGVAISKGQISAGVEGVVLPIVPTFNGVDTR